MIVIRGGQSSEIFRSSCPVDSFPSPAAWACSCWALRRSSPTPAEKVLDAIATYPNICRQLHLPAQSGNSNVLVSAGAVEGEASCAGVSACERRMRRSEGRFALPRRCCSVWWVCFLSDARDPRSGWGGDTRVRRTSLWWNG